MTTAFLSPHTPPVLNFTDSKKRTDGSYTVEIGPHNIGAANANRVVYVTITGTTNVSRSITYFRISSDGATWSEMTQIVYSNGLDAGGRYLFAAIYGLLWPTGTQAYFHLLLSGISGIGNGQMFGIYTSTAPVIHDYDAASALNTDPVALSLNSKPSSVGLIAGLYNDYPVTNITFDGATKDFFALENDTGHAAARKYYTTEDVQAVTLTPSGTPDGGRAVGCIIGF